MVNFDGLRSKKTWVGLGLGQFVSLLITSSGFSSSELSRRGINAPTSQSFLNYVLLAIFYGGFMIYRRKPFRCLGIITLCFLLLMLRPIILTKYRLRKFVGVAICVAGLVLVVFSDVHASYRGGGPNPLKGDMLVIGGSMLYAISNVSEEFLVKKGDRVELMAMLGIFGAVVSGIQISIVERNELRSIHWTTGAVLPFVGFALAMFLFYSTVPIILKKSGSTMLNLSLLTSDMWAVLIRIFAYHQKVDWMYFIAFGAVAVGLVVYSGGDKEQGESTDQVSEADADVEKGRDEEAGIGNPAQGSSAAADNVSLRTRNSELKITGTIVIAKTGEVP